MTIETLFGEEQAPAKPRTIKLKRIRAVYEKMVIKEETHGYLQPFTRYNSPEQIFDTFGFLRQETKEYFFTIHLDGKNRISCVDEVSVGSLYGGPGFLGHENEVNLRVQGGRQWKRMSVSPVRRKESVARLERHRKSNVGAPTARRRLSCG